MKKEVEKDNLTDKELQKQLFPGLAIPNNPDIARVSLNLFFKSAHKHFGSFHSCPWNG